ncbi:MAG: PIN domain-containing protein [Chloroflexi bacterium]|nr:PIN domain-containing protein [Chloroflexota bacterium]
MRALIDTNVVLDMLLERDPFVEDAQAIWRANREGRFQGYGCAITPGTVYYVAYKQTHDAKYALGLVVRILQAFYISPVDRDVLKRALQLEMTDFEDAIQSASAQADGLDFIITRDVKGYEKSPVKAITPADFVKELQ